MANIKLPDLDLRNILDVVKENFERVNLKAFAIRMIYTGEHGCKREEMARQFGKSIKFVNQAYTDIPVNGLLLVYDSYFVHILEGSEDTLYRQLRFIFHIQKYWEKKMHRLDEEAVAAALAAAAAAAALAASEGRPPPVQEEINTELPERIMFKRLKLLMVYHSVTDLLFDNWRAIFARPPSLVGKLDLYAPLEEHMEQLRVCLDKITKLCQLSQEDPRLSFDGLSANDPKTEALPEVALLDYLLNSMYILDLREVASYHRRVDDYIFYFEQVWPLPTAFTPQNLYKLKIDDSFVEPLPIMPWEIKTEEPHGDEAEDQDQPSKSDSSD